MSVPVRSLLVVLAVVVLFTPASATAALKTWNGSLNGNWNTAGNWDPSGVPANGDTLAFPTLAPGSFAVMTNNIPTPARQFESVNFNAGGYTLRGAALIVNNGVNSFNGLGLNTVELNVTLAAPQTFFNSSPGFTMNGNVNLAGFDLTLDAGDTTDIFNIGGAISGTGDIVKVGTGAARFQGPSPNTYNGTTTVSNGELRLAKADGITAVPGDIDVRPGSRVTWLADNQVQLVSINAGAGALLDLDSHTEAIGALTLSNATVNLGGGLLILGADVTVRGTSSTFLPPGTVSLGVSSRTFDIATGATLSITPNVAGGSRIFGGTLVIYAGLTKEGGGTLLLSGTNTYGGGTLINAGRIHANSDMAFGATVLPPGSIPGAVTINPGGQIHLNGADIGAKELFINHSEPGIALTSAGSSSWSGPISLNGNVIISAVGNLSFTNTITGPGGLFLESTLATTIFRLAGLTGNDFEGDVLLRDGTLELAKISGGGRLAVPHNLFIGEPGDGANVKTVRYLGHAQMDGDVIIECAGVLDLNNFADNISSLTLVGGTVNTGTGSLTIDNGINVETAPSSCTNNFINGRLAFASPGPRSISLPTANLPTGAPSLMVNATIFSSPELVIAGNSGQVILNGTNTFLGVLRLQSGFPRMVVRVNQPGAFGAISAGTILDGAILELGGVNLAAEPLTNVNSGSLLRTIGDNSHGGPIVLIASLVHTNPFSATPQTTELSGPITGPGSMTKAGSGTLRFSGATANTFGTMHVKRGLLEMNKAPGQTAASPLILGENLVTGNSSATARNLQHSQTDVVTVNEFSTWELNGFNDVVVALVLDHGGSVSTGAGTLELTNSGSISVSAFDGNSSTISGNLDLGSSGTRLITVNGGFGLFLSAKLSGNAGFEQAGFGEIRLFGHNTFAGNVFVRSGTLRIYTDDALGAASGPTTIDEDGRLNLYGVTITNESLTLNTRTFGSGFESSDQTNVWAGPITVTGSAVTIHVVTNTALILDGPISGPGGITKTGLGRLEFVGAAANTYLGSTRVNEGLLELRKSVTRGAIPGDLFIGDTLGDARSDVLRVVGRPQIATTSDITIAAPGLLDLNNQTETVGMLSGGGQVDFGPTGDGGLILNVNSSAEYSGLIVGNGLPPFAIRKRGTGTLTLSGNNTYTGTNSVENGTLLMNGSQPQTAVNVSSGATLGGHGLVGPVSVFNQGTLAPGSSSGILSTRITRLHIGASFRVDLDGPAPGAGYDQLNVTGPVDISGSALLAVNGAGYGPANGDVLTILNNDGTDSITGVFTGRPEGTLSTLGGIQYRISYVGGTGNDIILTVTNIPLRFAASRIESGNGDGRIDPNECDHLFVVLENRSGSAVTGIRARLDSFTPEVAITQPESDYPNIPALGFGTNTMAFQLRMSPGFPCGQIAELSLVISSAGAGNFRVPVTLHSGEVGNCGSGGGGCESCLASVSGTLTTFNPRLTERLRRDGISSGCGNLKICPGTEGTNSVRYRVHTFTNSGPDTCITVVLTVPCPALSNALQSVAYLTSFNGSDPCANYLGDSGAGVFNGSIGYSFPVPTGATFLIIVNEIFGTANEGCNEYALQLYGLPCPAPTLLAEKLAAPPNRVRISWSTGYPAFQLQRSPDVNGTPPYPFVNVPGAPLVINGRYTVTTNATTNDDYFRLRRP